MTRVIFCQKLQQDAPGLERPPYPGPLGKKIFEHISQQAWQTWLVHQTMLINEYRLNLVEAKAREYLEKEMEKFLFGEGSAKPAGFVEVEHK